MSLATEPSAKKAHLWARDDLDWYVEPIWATTALLQVERFIGDVWDPACGSGNIVRACHAAGLSAIGTDIIDRTDAIHWFCGERDFLKEEGAMPSNIITNPPFFRAKGTESFARKALSVARGKVAIFADIKFLAGQARAKGLWANHPPTRVWILAERPSCPPGDFLAAGNKASGGTADWCWLVWDLTAPRGRTELGWLAPGAGKAVAA